jgi:Fe-S-cluster containining protein
MTIDITNISTEPDPSMTCSTCQACCCRLEVMIITDTGVPEEYIDIDEWGGEVMLRLDAATLTTARLNVNHNKINKSQYILIILQTITKVYFATLIIVDDIIVSPFYV